MLDKICFKRSSLHCRFFGQPHSRKIRCYELGRLQLEQRSDDNGESISRVTTSF